ncbi:hypothetical protein QW180_31385 [Vibrio sinaloensis]|nr:hypothetical protein [Vibrio sinaloensis]
MNEATNKRNLTITATAIGVIALLALFIWRLTQPPEEPEMQLQDVGFGAVVTDDFTAQDNKSALTYQQGKK